MIFIVNKRFLKNQPYVVHFFKTLNIKKTIKLKSKKKNLEMKKQVQRKREREREIKED